VQILFGFSFVFLSIRFLVTLANFITRPVLRKQKQDSNVLVSILIPARNEESTIGNLLKSIQLQDYQNYEVIVLDDSSSDDTLDVVEKYCHLDQRFKVIQGLPLPVDWLGKNWACHQLSQKASGAYFLFLDADVTIDSGFINSCVVNAQQNKLALFSVFPHQYMVSEGEKIVVPIMHYLLLTLLPLRLILLGKQPSLAAANGQCMLFEGEIYNKYLFHEKVKRVVTEDIRIMQLVKGFGLKGNTQSADSLIHCRMYQNYSEGIQGFSKNILAGFAGSALFLMVYLFFTFFVYFFPSYWQMGEATTIATIFMIIAMKIFLSILSGQPILPNLYYHPLQMATIVWVGGLSIYKKTTKTNTWKGRTIPTESA